MGKKHISRSIKHFFVKFLLTFIKGFNQIIKSFFCFLKKLFLKPIKKILIIFYKLIILNFYKSYYLLGRLIKLIIPSDKIKPVYLFLNKYISHIIIIILVISVSFANFTNTETRAEGFGEKSYLFALATGGNMEDEYIEETLASIEQPAVTSYLNSQTTAVSANQQILTTKEAAKQEDNSVLAGDSSTLVKPEISSMEASKKHRDKPVEYIVQSGNTISSIADKFGISTNTILWENSLSKSSLIKPDQKLTILPTSGVSHKIASGDTIAKIAKKYQAEEEKIIEFNKLADATDIQVGQTIFIPEGQPYYVPIKTNTRLASVKKIFTPTQVSAPTGGKMLWPTTARRISQYYNWRHTGLDIDGDFGDPIWAPEDGVVTKVAYLKYGYGYHVILDHGGGKTTLYAHFQKIYVQPGQTVARGEILGEMGSTGYSTGSHLHFEVRFSGKKYNPLNYIR